MKTTPAAADAAAPTKPDEAKAPKRSLVTKLQPVVPKLLIGIEEKIIDWFGRIPQPADPKWEAELKECTDELLFEWFPNVALSPKTGALLALAALGIDMGWGAPKKEPKPGPEAPKQLEDMARPPATAPAIQPKPKPMPAPLAQRPPAPLVVVAPLAATRDSAVGTDATTDYSPSILDSSQQLWTDQPGSVKTAAQSASAV